MFFRTNTILPLFFFIIVSFQSFAQQLPKWLTDKEQVRMDKYYLDYSTKMPPSGTTTPPPGNVRTMAEWEEIQSLVVTWTSYPETLTEIIRHAKEECEVMVICSNPASVQNYLSSRGVDMVNVNLIQEGYNTVWMRDYGANTVYMNDVDSLVLVDWIYNRPRPLDDAIPERVAEEHGLELFTTTQAPNDLVHTGGNFMSDGLGTAFSSELVLEENEAGNPYGVTVKSSEDIDQIMDDFMGIDTYIKMTVLPYDGIHHIDMHMKLLDEETLLIGEYPTGVADGPQIESNIQYIQENFQTPYGEPYKIVRVQMPPDASGNYPNVWWADYRTYTNSVFVNKTVLVPIYDEQFDTTALRIYEENLPGYNVVGIDCNDIIQAGGALHCITRAVGVNDPLWIAHNPLEDLTAAENTSDYLVEATIKHKSGISGATLFYKTDIGDTYASTPMVEVTTGSGNWTADLPQQVDGSTVYYYINAVANNGKTIDRPIVAPEGYFHFRIGESSTPTIAVQPTEFARKIFPNPAKESFNISLETAIESDLRIELIDVHGRLLQTIFSGDLPSGKRQFIVDTGQYPPGAYWVRYAHSGKVFVDKLVIR